MKMAKRLSPRKYIYDNGNLRIKHDDEINININKDMLILDESPKNKKLFKKEHQKATSNQNIKNYNEKLFSTELECVENKANKKKEVEQLINSKNENELSDYNNKEDKNECCDFNSEYNKLTSIENHYLSSRLNPRLLLKLP